jgi:hypothetical protein
MRILISTFICREPFDFFQAFYVLLFAALSLVKLNVCVHDCFSVAGSSLRCMGFKRYIVKLFTLLVYLEGTSQNMNTAVFDINNNGYLPYAV